MDEYFYACDKGDLDVVKKCVEEGVDINGLTIWGGSPFIQACRNNCVNVVEYLIDAGVDVAHLNVNKEVALMHACGHGHIKIVELLLVQNSTISFIRQQTGAGRWTALMYAAKYGTEDVVKLLLLYDPSEEHILMKNEDGKTAIDLAKSDEIRELLKSPPEVQCKRAKPLF